jgi:dihydrofolate synthase/folylpolyglutamate synthase
LLGDYQQKNCKTVLKVLQIIQEQKRFSISEENIKNGLMYVVKNTRLQGRWQQIHENPTAICDTGHNAHGLKIVLQQVLNQKYKKLRVVLGVVNDKDLDEILPLFPKKAQYYFCKPNVQRGLSAEILQQNAEKFGLMGSNYTSVNEAYKTAIQQSEKEDFIFVGGSTFVVAEII